jgi:hypothetical protein
MVLPHGHNLANAIVFLHLPSADRSQRDETGRGVAHLDAYGLGVETDISLPGTQPTRPAGRPHAIALRAAPAAELPSLLDEPRYLRNLQAYDGAAFAMLESPEGDVLFAYGRTALFHLSADYATLRCAVAAQDGAAWQRVLLDTVLWTVSLLRGFELLHASAVTTDHGLVALVARTGGGKTSLAAEFLRRGATLFSDDVVALDSAGGEVIAHPGPPLMNLPRALAPAELGGVVVADFGDDRWVALHRATVVPSPLAAVVLVNRVAGESARCSPTAATSLTLLPHAVSLPHLADRARRRFDIFGSVIATVPVLLLHADPAVPPSELADLIERRLVTL